jgi:hypothetical protein
MSNSINRLVCPPIEPPCSVIFGHIQIHHPFVLDVELALPPEVLEPTSGCEGAELVQ